MLAADFHFATAADFDGGIVLVKGDDIGGALGIDALGIMLPSNRL